MTESTLTVAELLATVDQALAAHVPGPVWVRGEITGLRRTSGGAIFLRLADPEVDGQALDVFARGRVIEDIDRALRASGMGSLRPGIEVRVQGTLGISHRQSGLRLSLLAVDPEFTVGRLALDRARVLELLGADGTLQANKTHPLPLVPLRVGLVTSRGSAAHADFLDQLRRSGFRFVVRTAHTTVQGETAHLSLTAALDRLAQEPVDVVAVIRGGGARLDLATFDTETVGRAVAAMPVPVITGIGHEIDWTVADHAAAIPEKTPSSAGEWLVARVGDYSRRIDTARNLIWDEARGAQRRAQRGLDTAVVELATVRGALAGQQETLERRSADVVTAARDVLVHQDRLVAGFDEFFSTVGVEATLARGFALVTTSDGRRVIRSADDFAAGDRLLVRFADGTVPVVVEKP
ncbi:MAG: exodeoxyribonuclease VII large subunit [Acidimicrobiia bacterium]